MLSLHAARLIYDKFSSPLPWQCLRRTSDLTVGERASLAQAPGGAELLRMQQPWKRCAV